MSSVDETTAAQQEETAPRRPASLWKHRDFLLYWFSQTVSRSGSRIAEFALPLTAIFLFDASSQELGVVSALAYAPYLFMTLFAGVWIDRSRKRRVLMTAELGRVVALSAVLGIYLADGLSLVTLYGVALVLGMCAVLFDISGAAYLPSLVQRDQLVDGNAKLQATIVVTQSGGPAVGGLLTQLLSAPAVLAGSVFSPILSLLSLCAMRHREPRPEPSAEKRATFREIREALRFIAHDRYLRFLTLRSGVNNIFFTARNTLLPLFVLQTLALSPGSLGIILGAGSVGGFVGALCSRPLAKRMGPGRVVVLGYGGSSLSQVVLPLATGPTAVALGMLIPMFFVSGLFMTIGNTNVAALQQMMIPRHRLGRVLAGMRTVTWGSMPVGALAGGFLGALIGVREALAVAAMGFCLSALWMALSPVAKLRRWPEPPED